MNVFTLFLMDFLQVYGQLANLPGDQLYLLCSLFVTSSFFLPTLPLPLNISIINWEPALSHQSSTLDAFLCPVHH